MDLTLIFKVSKQYQHILTKSLGLYNLREKVSENLVASKHDVNPNEVTMLTNNAEIVDGDNAEFLALRQFLSKRFVSN